MNRTILIIGPQGSGKTTKVKQLTKGKRTVIQNPTRNFAFSNNPPEFYVFEEFNLLNDPIAIKLIMTLHEVKNIEHRGIVKPRPTIIITSQCPMNQIPGIFINEGFEIIDLHRSN